MITTTTTTERITVNSSLLDRRIGNLPKNWRDPLVEVLDTAETVHLWLAQIGQHDNAEALVGTLIREQFVAIAEEDGQPVGLIAGVCQPHALNPDLTIATELAWWVVPPKRGTRAGLLLLEHFDTWASGTGAHLVNMTLEVGSPVSDRCLTKRGYAMAERQYLREIVS